MNLLRILLFPVSLLYGLLTWVRNKLFDWGILPSRTYSFPLIGVGNLSTGGTGKTPHIEYLVRLLKPHYNLATLSRGYKRKTRGFQRATQNSTAREVGDEPLQIYQQHPDVTVTVCESRKNGIKIIREQEPGNQVILLDDVFQHRYVKPGLNLLLTDYHKIFSRNYLLPTGNLRECRRGARRADALIVTKTPCVFSPLDRKLILQELDKYGINQIFFSYIKYGKWVPLTPAAREQKEQKVKTVFMFTGIANPIPMAEHLKRQSLEFISFVFSDHYQFTASDLERIRDRFYNTFSGSKALVTTEKDSMRLKDPALQKIIQSIPVYYLPIEVEFHKEDKLAFDAMVTEYTRKNMPPGDKHTKKSSSAATSKKKKQTRSK